MYFEESILKFQSTNAKVCLGSSLQCLFAGMQGSVGFSTLCKKLALLSIYSKQLREDVVFGCAFFVVLLQAILTELTPTI